ncbi:MAG TPA: MFS transporter [Actinophytocola sp.]|uniref:MFS transporter n=1 Tax=Actinophytocola sp. TaxID=1872138 RepID=UPI002DBDDC4C|nr:MFS transporter [Actinophytocola sp.]HEU5469675.1 MFS transporter [Actinophytocola sp.]
MPADPANRAGRSLLRDRDFAKFWGAETISLFGAQVTELAVLLTAVVELGASAFEVGLLNVARFVPFIVLSLLVGVWFDRRRRWPVLVAGNLARALVVGVVPVAALLGVLSVPLLLAVAFLVGVLTVVFDVGSTSYLPGLVDRGRLTEANSRLQTSFSLAAIAGPGLAGLLIGVLTAPNTLVICAAVFAGATVPLALITHREPSPPAGGQDGLARSIHEGLRAVFGDRTLKNLATQSATYNFFQNIVITVFSVYALRELALSPAQLGFVLAAGSVGTLIGALAAARVAARLGVGSALRVATLIGCVAPILLLVPHGSGPAALVALAAALAVHGANLAVFNITALTLRQCITPDRLLGRMNASYRLLLYGTVPFGAFLGGVLAELVGLRGALIIGVAGLAVPIAWIPFSPAYTIRTMPDKPYAS